jgi:hypothetical protein
VNEHEIEIGPNPIDDFSKAARFVRHDYDVPHRAQDPWSRAARSCRFDQRFYFEPERTPPERKRFDYDDVRPRHGEGGKEGVPTNFLQILVDRLAVRTNETLEGCIAGPDRRELNNTDGFRTNGPCERLSA